MTQFHVPTAMQAAGLLFLFMPVVTWTILARQSSRAVALWCVGSALTGLGAVTLGLRDTLPDWATFPLANFLILHGLLMRVEVFRLELGEDLRAWLPLLLSLLAIAVFEILRHSPGLETQRLQYMLIVLALAFLACARMAWRFSRSRNNRSARWIAAACLPVALALTLRAVEAFFQAGPPSGVDSTPLGVAIALTGMISAVVTQLAYAGMKLELAERAREQSDHAYAAVRRVTRDGFFVTDLDGRFLDVNDIYARMLGRSREEMIGMPVAAIEAAMSPGEIADTLELTKAAGYARFETRSRRLDGQVLDVEVSVSHLPDDGGRLIGIVRNISDRKRFERELERCVQQRTEQLAIARAEAEAANAVRTRFLSNLSHEMRSPLNVILGFAELGRDKAGEREAGPLAGYFAGILESGQRMRKLVEDLLSLVDRAWYEDAGGSEPAVDIVPTALAAHCLNFVHTAAGERRQQLAFVDDSCIGRIRGNERRLRQVLEHLLGNAIRYTPEGRRITLRLFDAALRGECARALGIQVIDEGCGLPEQEIQAIFEPFYQSSRTADGAGGTGLGLALCRAIVQRHGGALSARNRPEGGAVFEVTLPAAV